VSPSEIGAESESCSSYDDDDAADRSLGEGRL